jgi:hypothetical protein
MTQDYIGAFLTRFVASTEKIRVLISVQKFFLWVEIVESVLKLSCWGLKIAFILIFLT